MIQLTPHMRILVAVKPVDFRKGIDGLAQVCREVLTADPFSGVVCVFRNRRGTSVKLLVYDGRGFWLCQKRLSEGRFKFWPSEVAAAGGFAVEQLQVLLAGGDPAGAKVAPVWRRISVNG